MLKERWPEDLIDSLDVWQAAVVNTLTIRARTAEFYRQQKFNLLHEETEGYAKLLDALHSAFTASPAPSDLSLLSQQVTALIGYFDLDPNRVVDVLLSVYHPLANPHNLPALLALLPLFNPSHVAQLAGFKCQHYYQAGAAPPLSFFDVLAALIRHSNMPVEAIWPHLTPADDELRRIHSQWAVEEAAKAGKVGLVSLAGGDERKEEVKEERKEVTRDVTKDSAQNRNDAGLVMGEALVTIQPSIVLTQPPPLPTSPFTPAQSGKFYLLASLIAIHAWPQAQQLLTYLSALEPLSHPAVSAALCTHVTHLIAPFMRSISASFFVLQRTADNEGLRGMTIATQVDDDALLALPSVLQPALSLLGVYLYTDPVLFTQLCRLFSHIIALDKKRQRESTVSYTPPAVLDSLLTSVLIPAYSLLPSAVAHCASLWSVISLLPYPLRFRVYGEWHHSTLTRHPLLRLHHSHLLQKTKYFRKRISTAKVKECSRLLLKFALSSPTIVFALVLQQLQNFDNMIIPVVDMLRYVPPLVLDSLTYLLLIQITEGGAKLKDDGMNESHWFQSLTAFAGHLYRRYPEVDLLPPLQFIANELKLNQSLDLLLLKEMVSGMSGVEVYEEMSEAVMEGRMGSRLLREETSTVRNVARNKRRATHLLVDSLTRHQLLVPLYVLLSTEKDGIVYDTEYEHTRLVGELHDKCNDVLLAYVDMIDAQLTDVEYAKAWPSLYDLITVHGLQMADAMHLLRRVIHIQRIQGNEEWKKAEERRRHEGEEEEPINPGQMMDDGQQASVAAIRSKAVQSKKQPHPHPYAALHDTLTRVLDPTVLSSIPVGFYALFWRLSMYHLHVPKAAYEAAGKKLRGLLSAVDRGEGEWADGDDGKRRKEKERLNRLLSRLKEDETRHVQDHQLTLNTLKKEKETWLTSVSRGFFAAFAHHCLLPRLFLSPLDSVYAARFLSTIARLHTPRFCVVLMWDAFFNHLISPLICSCTSSEATRFGRFLHLVLIELHRCVYDPTWYDREASKSPAFASKVNEPSGAKFTHAQMHIIMTRCHKNMMAAFQARLDSGDKMEMGNALLVLVKIGGEWPKVASQGVELEKKIEAVITAEGKEGSSLKVLATRAHALLMAQKKNWKQDGTVGVVQKAGGVAAPPTVSKGQSSRRSPSPAGDGVGGGRSSAPRGNGSAKAGAVSTGPAAARPLLTEVAVSQGADRAERRDGRDERNTRSSSERGTTDRTTADRGTTDRGGTDRGNTDRSEGRGNRTAPPAASTASTRGPSPTPPHPAAVSSAAGDARGSRESVRAPSPSTPARPALPPAAPALNPSAPVFTPESERSQRSSGRGSTPTPPPVAVPEKAERKDSAPSRDSKDRDRDREAKTRPSEGEGRKWEREKEREPREDREKQKEAPRDSRGSSGDRRGEVTGGGGGGAGRAPSPSPSAPSRDGRGLDSRGGGRPEERKGDTRERDREAEKEPRQSERTGRGGLPVAPPAAVEAPQPPQHKRRREEMAPLPVSAPLTVSAPPLLGGIVQLRVEGRGDDREDGRGKRQRGSADIASRHDGQSGGRGANSDIPMVYMSPSLAGQGSGPMEGGQSRGKPPPFQSSHMGSGNGSRDGGRRGSEGGGGGGGDRRGGGSTGGPMGGSMAVQPPPGVLPLPALPAQPMGHQQPLGGGGGRSGGDQRGGGGPRHRGRDQRW